MDPITKMFSDRYKNLIKILFLAMASFSIVILTVTIPRLITLKPSQSPEDAVKYITTQPVLGLPIPFYINGRTLRLYDVKYFLHEIPFPIHIYLGNPLESGGSRIVFSRFFADFLILFVPLLIIFVLKRKFVKKAYSGKSGIKKFLKRLALVFVSSLVFVIASVFTYLRTFYRADLLGKHDCILLGFPFNFISVYVRPDTLKFPYHLPAKTILDVLVHRRCCFYLGAFFSDAVLVSIIILLIYYAYKD